MSLYLFHSLSLSPRSASLSLSLSLSFSVCLSLSRSASLSFSVCLSLFLGLPLSLSRSASLSLSRSASLHQITSRRWLIRSASSSVNTDRSWRRWGASVSVRRRRATLMWPLLTTGSDRAPTQPRQSHRSPAPSRSIFRSTVCGQTRDSNVRQLGREIRRAASGNTQAGVFLTRSFTCRERAFTRGSYSVRTWMTPAEELFEPSLECRPHRG